MGAGIIHQHIKAAVASHDLGDGLLPSLGLGDVERDAPAPVGMLLGELDRVFRSSVDRQP